MQLGGTSIINHQFILEKTNRRLGKATERKHTVGSSLDIDAMYPPPSLGR
jgi:hypothetical protein